LIRRRIARRQRLGQFAARAAALDQQAATARDLAVAIPTTWTPPRRQPVQPLVGHAAQVNTAVARGQLARGDQ
jgi:hypothetical protein